LKFIVFCIGYMHPTHVSHEAQVRLSCARRLTLCACWNWINPQ